MGESTPFKNLEASTSIDYMLRNVQQHHIQLSLMADQKASIIIAATSIVFTISLSRLDSQHLVWGLVSLGVFSFVALVFAILSLSPVFRATRPMDPQSPGFNPLFFGHFTDLSLDQYCGRMEEIMKDQASIYEALVKDIYQVGTVLKDSKYRHLRVSYRTFFAGLVLSVVLFAVQFAGSV